MLILLKKTREKLNLLGFCAKWLIAINNKNHTKCWFCDRVAGEIWFDEIYCVILQFVVGLLPKFLARKEFDRALRMVLRTYYYFEARLYGNKRIAFISNLMVY